MECTLLDYTIQKRILQDWTLLEGALLEDILLEGTLLEDTLLEATLLDMSQAMVSGPWPGQDPAMVMGAAMAWLLHLAAPPSLAKRRSLKRCWARSRTSASVRSTC